MKNIIATLGVIGVFLLAFTIGVATQEASSLQLSGTSDTPYVYRHIDSDSASSTAGTIVLGGSGVVGSLTINSATATADITLYDGATSATSSLDVIGIIDSTATFGTYTYEIAVSKGLVVDLTSGFTGDITFSVK